MSHLQIVIDSRGGGGHLAVGKAAAAEWNALGENYETKRIDFLGEGMMGDVNLPFVGSLGDMAVNRWNDAQIKGDVAGLKSAVSMRWLSDLIFYPIAVRKFTEYLRRLPNEPERIVSTQALCIDALAQAILTVNRERGWNMRLQVRMTDLPTEEAEHFYRSLRNVGNNETLSRIVTLYAPCKPQCKNGETEQGFWKRHVGDVRVLYPGKLPIREAFFDHHCSISKTMDLQLRVNHPHELEILRLGAKDGELPESLPTNKKINFHIPKEDRVATLMLGSQPPDRAVNGYIDAFIQAAAAEEATFKTVAKTKNLSTLAEEHLPQYHLFVFCGKPEDPSKPGEVNALLRKVENRLQSYSKANGGPGLPSNLRIVPFTYQDDETLAPLLHGSKMIVAKSGGSTCFELMQLNDDVEHQALPSSERRNVFIHSEGLHPDGDDFTDFLAALWQAIVSFIEWFFRVKEYPDLGDIYPNVLTPQDIYDIQGACRMAASNHGLRSNIHVDPFFTEANLRGDAAPTVPFYASFDAITKKYSQNDDSRYFTEKQRVTLIETKTEQLLEKARSNRKAGQPLPKFEDMRKIAIQKLLIEQGIPLWEGGNAESLQLTMNAKVVSPTYVSHFLPGAFFKTETEINEAVDDIIDPSPIRIPPFLPKGPPSPESISSDDTPEKSSDGSRRGPLLTIPLPPGRRAPRGLRNPVKGALNSRHITYQPVKMKTGGILPVLETFLDGSAILSL